MGEVAYRFLKKFRIRNMIIREFLAEFIGTFILILIGNASFAWQVLEGGPLDVFGLVWAWSVAVFLAITISIGVSGGHVNPAVTIAFATLRKFPWYKVGHYLLAQYLGAFIACCVLFVEYKEALDHFDPNRTIVGPTRTALIFATYPREYVSLTTCFFDQIIGTGLLMFNVLAIIDERNTNIPKHLYAFFFGLMIAAIAMCFGLNCMAALNPARDFSGRLFTAIFGWGFDTFTYKSYFWIGIIPVHLGAIIGGWLYYLFIELHWPPETQDKGVQDDAALPLTSNDHKIKR